MKKTFFSSSKFYYLAIIFPVAMTALGLMLNSNSSKQNQNLADIKYGVNLCFTRLTQSVIALQSHDYFSKHLERSYVDFTNECFFEFKEKVLTSFSDIEASKLVDQLLEDAQLFSKSLLALLNKRQSEISRTEMQAQVLPAYSKVDFSRFNLNQWIKAKEGNASWWSWQNAFFAIILMMLNAALIYFLWQARVFQQLIAKQESRANDICAEFEQQPHRLEIFLMQVFDYFNLQKTQEVFKKYSQALMDQSTTLARMREGKNAVPETKESEFTVPEPTEWREAANTLVDQKIADTVASQPPAFINKIEVPYSADAASEWTEEDESENILHQPQINLSPISEPVTDLADLINTSSKCLSNTGSHTMIVHKATHAPFWLKGDHEHFEQLFIALINKIEQRFNEFSVANEERCINTDFHFDAISNQVEITLNAKGTLFHIDDLEYFFDQDHLTVDSYNVIVKEMVKELYGEISFKNLIGENLQDNSLQIILKVPGRERATEQQTSKVVQIVKGKKKDLMNTGRSKEITI